MRLVCDRVGPSWSNLHAWSWSGGRCSMISCFGTQWFAWCVGVSFVVVRGPTKGKCWQLTRRRMPKVGGAPTAGRKWSLVALRWCNGLSCCTRLAAFVVSRRTSAILFKLVVGGFAENSLRDVLVSCGLLSSFVVHCIAHCLALPTCVLCVCASC